jgi:hypothetical protein
MSIDGMELSIMYDDDDKPTVMASDECLELNKEMLDRIIIEYEVGLQKSTRKNVYENIDQNGFEEEIQDGAEYFEKVSYIKIKT